MRRERKSKSKFGRLSLFLFVVIVAVVVFFFFFAASFGGLARVSLASADSSGNVIFSLFDFKGGTISTVVVPGSTQVDVARSLGFWKISSVWKLGENEKVGGVLLSETVTKSLKMPVDYWGEGSYSGLSSDDPSKIVRGVFSLKQTNLSLIDRIRIGIFTLQTRSVNRRTVDLADSKYLYKVKLSDGTLGYKVRDSDLPFELKAILADADVSKENSNILLENLSGKGYIEAEVGAIIEVLGGKIAKVTKGEVKDTDCTLYGDSKLVTYRVIAKVFSCSRAGKLDNYNFDIVLRIGTKFTARY